VITAWFVHLLARDEPRRRRRGGSGRSHGQLLPGGPLPWGLLQGAGDARFRRSCNGVSAVRHDELAARAENSLRVRGRRIARLACVPTCGHS